MKISVVTVCLNSERTIALTIESFLKQTYPNKEMLVIDGMSRDRTVEIARSFGSDAIRVISESDKGIYDAMNKGLRWFSGDAVGFIGSDDMFHGPRSLELLAAGLQNADVVYGDVHIVKDHVSKAVVRTHRGGKYHPRALQRGWMPPHTTFYIRRHVVRSVGEFDTRYRIGADYDFVLRTMALNSFRNQYIPQILVDFQIGGVSSRGFFRSTLVHNLEALDSRRRLLGAAVIDAAFFMKPARSFMQLHWR
jgi:glycosyltransferase